MACPQPVDQPTGGLVDMRRVAAQSRHTPTAIRRTRCGLTATTPRPRDECRTGDQSEDTDPAADGSAWSGAVCRAR